MEKGGGEINVGVHRLVLSREKLQRDISEVKRILRAGKE